MPIEYMFCVIFKQTMHDNYFVAQKLHGFLALSLRKLFVKVLPLLFKKWVG